MGNDEGEIAAIELRRIGRNVVGRAAGAGGVLDQHTELALQRHEIAFDEKTDLIFNKRQKLPYHSNGMRFSAYGDNDTLLATRDYYSVGGGFVVNQDEAAEDRIVADTTPLPFPFHSGDELLKYCEQSGKTIAGVMLATLTPAAGAAAAFTLTSSTSKINKDPPGMPGRGADGWGG